ncbi:MAG: bifunctional (p)ppGpp synthetase/guanosine-3',5'-bis(diphosphate) 3'-pyrophosphohydrolase, partial [Candidatus Aenigmarchaeota archaeon]|nr:bifunctional (p)ppGpp synthetase/guanosine-3',5'-bis(diphosphate) 3'-pyrophosphohydrolase [Candidatus Aenigmarchaeota archaeon]
THPLAVGQMLEKAGYSEDVVVAGILHDTVEDTKITLDYITSEFGGTVAGIVKGASEPDKSLSWEERKKHTIEYLRTAPTDVHAVACADKLHNITTMEEDYADIGEDIWKRFKRGKEHQKWYYESIVESLYPEEDEYLPLYSKLRDAVGRMFG